MPLDYEVLFMVDEEGIELTDGKMDILAKDKCRSENLDMNEMFFYIAITITAKREFLCLLRDIRYQAENDIKLFKLMNERINRLDINDFQIERINKRQLKEEGDLKKLNFLTLIYKEMMSNL
jgi:hypothetical protein